MELPDKSNSPPGRAGKPAAFRMGIMLSTAGLELGIATAIGAFTGQYLDKRFELDNPWFTIGLLLAGLAAGFLNLFRLVKRAEKKHFTNPEDDHQPPITSS